MKDLEIIYAADLGLLSVISSYKIVDFDNSILYINPIKGKISSTELFD